MPAPPFLEFKVAGSFSVDFGIEIVLLGPIGVGGIEVLEVTDEPGTIKFARSEIAHQRRKPGAAKQPTSIAHGVFAAHAGPIGERRSGNDDRTKKLGPLGSHHHHSPACLTIADDRGLAVGFGVERDHSLEKGSLSGADVLNRLTCYGLRQKANEIAGMAGLKRHADLALGLEPADAGPVTSTGIHDDERPLLLIDLDPFRRSDAGQDIVHGTRKLAPIHNQLDAELKNVRSGLGGVLLVLFASLLQDVEEKNPTLPSIHPIRPNIQGWIGPGHRRKFSCLQLGWGYLTDHRKAPPRKQRTWRRGAPAENHPPLKILQSMSLRDASVSETVTGTNVPAEAGPVQSCCE